MIIKKLLTTLSVVFSQWNCWLYGESESPEVVSFIREDFNGTELKQLKLHLEWKEEIVGETKVGWNVK